MTCRTQSYAGRGRRRRARRSAGCPTPTDRRAADLVVRVASIVPAPGEALCTDDRAWQAFDDFLGEAARLVVDALGRSGAPALRALLAAPPRRDAITQLLIERALDVLDHDTD